MEICGYFTHTDTTNKQFREPFKIVYHCCSISIINLTSVQTFVYASDFHNIELRTGWQKVDVRNVTRNRLKNVISITVRGRIRTFYNAPETADCISALDLRVTRPATAPSVARRRDILQYLKRNKNHFTGYLMIPIWFLTCVNYCWWDSRAKKITL